LSAKGLEVPQLQLPPEISACTALTSLQLSCASIPPPMWQLPLRELTLDQVHVADTEPQHFTRLSELQSLRLCNYNHGDEDHGNEDHGDDDLAIHTALAHLAVSPSLTCLRLDGNEMGHLVAFPALGQLLELDLKRNW
jgi:hypothetical protein